MTRRRWPLICPRPSLYPSRDSFPALQTHARTLPSPRHGTRSRRVRIAAVRVASCNTLATRISAGALAWASRVAAAPSTAENNMHPCTENPPMTGRARTPMSASASTSCSAFRARGAGSCLPGNPLAGQRVGWRHSRGIFKSMGRTRLVRPLTRHHAGTSSARDRHRKCQQTIPPSGPVTACPGVHIRPCPERGYGMTRPARRDTHSAYCTVCRGASLQARRAHLCRGARQGFSSAATASSLPAHTRGVSQHREPADG